ncbi:hypothetical protein LSUE1_G003642, partial [Lachnellula suecica]
QEILPKETSISPAPYQFTYPAILPDGSVFHLPIRPLNDTPDLAVASLLISHASFAVADKLESELAHLLEPFDADIIIGLPTLGLGPASNVAKILGQSRYVPLGYSRKFWYDESLSTLLSSITSPLGEKRVYLDPNLLPLIKGKNVVIIDDAISSGKTMKAVWDFLESDQIGCDIVACGVLMKQGKKWEEVLGPDRSAKLVGVFESPLLRAVEGGWFLRE